MKPVKDILGDAPDATPAWTARDGSKYVLLDSV